MIINVIDEKIRAIDNKIEETKKALGIVEGKTILASFYEKRKELQKQQTVLLGQQTECFLNEENYLSCISLTIVYLLNTSTSTHSIERKFSRPQFVEGIRAHVEYNVEIAMNFNIFHFTCRKYDGFNDHIGKRIISIEIKRDCVMIQLREISLSKLFDEHFTGHTRSNLVNSTSLPVFKTYAYLVRLTTSESKSPHPNQGSRDQTSEDQDSITGIEEQTYGYKDFKLKSILGCRQTGKTF
ncbi:15954_t:CDS:2 [Funneliformis caledonium]|uniref:15954_t:CDS:1 n=1 Tax=Funneliformis caledonium TaxID=1117310 RepID=A0A9N9CC45_9GLOM|nr:15954_t:CDS:2 [Funneliformis caledonium]